MDTKEFLGAILSDEGHYCITGIGSRGEGTKNRVESQFFTDVDEAIQTAQQFDQEGLDTYFALAVFENGGSRKNDNVKSLRSFFLDLDCGVGKDYESQAEALKSLRLFCKALNLPTPMLVNSGRGIHVYWPLDRGVAPDAWLPVAYRLKELCVEHSVYADPVVTADISRILRVLGTHNYKDNPPKPVSLIGHRVDPVSFDAFKALLGESPIGSLKKPYVPKEADLVMRALMGNFTSKFKTILMKTAQGTGCDQLKYIVQNQSEMSEPMWRAGLSIASFCEDRDKAIHRLSAGYPDYNRADTEHKVAHIRGPYTCSKFDEYNPGVCGTCPNHGKIKSPIVLGRELSGNPDEDITVVDHPSDIDTTGQPLQEYVIPSYPLPYRRGASGAIFKVVQKDDEEIEVPVYHNPLYVVKRINDPDSGESIVMRLHLPKDGVREFTMPLMSVMARDEFRAHMAKNGVAVMKLEELMTYVTTWVNKLQMEFEAEEAHRQFGWTEDRQSFIAGNMEIRANRVDINPPATSTVSLFPMFKPAGTLQGWKDTVEFYNRPGFEVHQYMMGLSFGAVLAEFTPINGSIFHLYHKESGLGKTTSMLAGASVWGNPESLVMYERDTTNSKMNRLEVYKNIPGYFDEMTNTAPKELSDFAYSVPAGSQRNRMSARSNVERYRGIPWHTLVGSTGNTDMVERISSYKAMPKAEAQRILSYRAPIIAFATKEETDSFSTALKQHYGHAGLIYAQYLLQHQSEIAPMLEEVQKKIDLAAGLKAENRFWSSQVACVVTGMIFAKRAGLVNYDIKGLVKWIITDLLVSAKDSADGMRGTVEDVLTDYIAENYNNMLRIDSTQDVRRDANGIEKASLPEASPRGTLVMRYEYDTKRLFILPKPFKDWCAKHQINYSGVIESLRDGRTNAQKMKQRLGKGTHVNLPPTDVWVLDCTHFMDDDREETIAAQAVLTERQKDQTNRIES